MRYGILSDIHGNLEALDAVLEALEEERIDRYLCLGDMVGYGASPNECLDRVIGLTTDVIAGNHDHAAIGKLDIATFNHFAAEAARWTRRQLTPAGRRYLAELPYTRRIGDLYAVHASPDNPGAWHYLTSLGRVIEGFEALPGGISVCVLGHTHSPGIFESSTAENRCREVPARTHPLAPENRSLANVGSVGQPRDGDPRAAYCVFDAGERRLEIKRVPYDMETVQRKIRDAGLPDMLAERLAHGR